MCWSRTQTRHWLISRVRNKDFPTVQFTGWIIQYTRQGARERTSIDFSGPLFLLIPDTLVRSAIHLRLIVLSSNSWFFGFSNINSFFGRKDTAILSSRPVLYKGWTSSTR